MIIILKKEELTAAYSNTSRLENNSSSAAADLASDSKLSWQEQKKLRQKNGNALMNSKRQKNGLVFWKIEVLKLIF